MTTSISSDTGAPDRLMPDLLGNRERQLDQLLAVTGEVVGGEIEPETALVRLSEAAQQFIAHDAVDIGWVEDGRNLMSLQQLVSIPKRERPGELEAIDGSGLESALLQGTPLIVGDYQDDTWRSRLRPRKLRQLDLYESRSAVIVPLLLGQRIIGMLEFQRRQPNAYAEADVETACRIADQIAPVVEALHLYKREEVARG